MPGTVRPIRPKSGGRRIADICSPCLDRRSSHSYTLPRSKPKKMLQKQFGQHLEKMPFFGLIWCLTAITKRRKTEAAMNVSKRVLWLLVATFLVSEGLLFSALRQKAALQIALQSEKQRAEQLQTQVDQLTECQHGGAKRGGCPAARGKPGFAALCATRSPSCRRRTRN